MAAEMANAFLPCSGGMHAPFFGMAVRIQICITILSSAKQGFVGSAGVAQSVEQLIRNEKVGCSIHLSGTNKINDLRVVVVQSAVSCHTQVTVDGTIWQH